MLIDRWESGIALKHGHEDTSQRGNQCHLRNEQFQGRPLVNVQSIAEWTLPTYDTLDFDYSSTKRAPNDAPVLDKVTLSATFHLAPIAPGRGNPMLWPSHLMEKASGFVVGEFRLRRFR